MVIHGVTLDLGLQYIKYKYENLSFFLSSLHEDLCIQTPFHTRHYKMFAELLGFLMFCRVKKQA